MTTVIATRTRKNTTFTIDIQNVVVFKMYCSTFMSLFMSCVVKPKALYALAKTKQKYNFFILA